MKYDAVIFDLDGTLIHTAPEYRHGIVEKTLKEFGVSGVKSEFMDKFWFESRREEIIRKNFGVAPESFWIVFRKYDTIESRKKSVSMYDDVCFIEELKKEGYKTGIVTGATVPIANMEIEIIGPEKFDAIVIAQKSNGINPKPHPHGVEECLSLLGAKKNKAIYVGNADEDILTAKNAGVFDVLLKRGEYEFEMKNLKPSLIIHSLYDLKKIFSC